MKRWVMCVVCVGALALSVSPVSGQSGAPALETAKVVAQMLDKTVTIPADLTPYQGVNIHAKVTSFVEDMRVDRGSWVKQGQTLATLSAPELQAQTLKAEAELQSARARQAEAEARTVSARSTFGRLRAAAQTPGVVAGNDVEIAEKTLEATQAQVEAMKSSVAAADAAIEALKDLESYLVLRAPFDGVITERHVHPGTLVGPSGTPVVRIEQISRLRLTVPVPETYVAGITRGTRVAFTVSAFPGQTFDGVIARPAYSLDMKTRSMLVELDVTNARQVLAPGMFAEVQWPISRAQASLFVPTTSVVRTSERQFVVRLRNGVAEWVDVRRGQVNGNLIEVFGDMREGDVVARRGSDEIRPGTRVAAVSAGSRP
jgi:membrane fusion protein (multidrug efflux system)